MVIFASDWLINFDELYLYTLFLKERKISLFYYIHLCFSLLYTVGASLTVIVEVDKRVI